METLVYILSFIIVLQTGFGLSLYPFPGRCLFAGISACWAWALYPYAIEQNNTFLQMRFSDRIDLMNIAGYVLVEALLLLAIRLGQWRDYFGDLSFPNPGWRRAFQLGSYFPGICFFAVLYYGEIQLFLQLDQFSFEQVGLGYTLLAGILGIALPTLIQWLLPERDLRLEMGCLLLVVQLLLAGVLSALPAIASYTPPANTLALSVKPILGWLGLLLLGGGIGYYRLMKKNRKRKKQHF